MFVVAVSAQRATGAEGGISQNHRMVWVGRDLTDHPVPTPCHGQGHLPSDQLLKALSDLALNPAREGAATASLGNLGHSLTTLKVQNFFLFPYLGPKLY